MSTQAIPELESQALAVQLGTDPTSIAEFEQDALALETEARAISVTDQDSYDCAVKCLEKIGSEQKNWADFIKRPYDVVYGTYKRILDLKKAVESPLEVGKRWLSTQISEFNRRAEEERQRVARELQLKQRKEEEERKLEAAASAESAGMSEQAVEQILAAPSVAPTPVAAPVYQRASNVSVRENWAGEVVDFHALVKAAAKDKNLLPLLEINQPALNAQARTHKSTLADVIPGVRGVNKGSVAVRGSR